jgi:hypothetical protein
MVGAEVLRYVQLALAKEGYRLAMSSHAGLN